MNDVIGRLIRMVSRMLTVDEGDAVLGDLAESGEAPSQVLAGLAGLVVRRQAARWKNWRPLVALIGVVGILGPRLIGMAWALAAPWFMNLQIYWKYGSFNASGLTPIEEISSSLMLLLALVFFAWTSGFAMGSLSRNTIWITAAASIAIWSFPLTLQWMLWLLLHQGDRHKPDLLGVVVMTAFQAILQLLFLVFPFVLGVRQGLRKLTLSMSQAGAAAVVMILIAALSVWTGGWSQAAVTRWATGAWNPSIGWQSRLLAIAVLSWPVAYLFVTAVAKTSPRKCTRKTLEFP